MSDNRLAHTELDGNSTPCRYWPPQSASSSSAQSARRGAFGLLRRGRRAGAIRAAAGVPGAGTSNYAAGRFGGASGCAAGAAGGVRLGR